MIRRARPLLGTFVEIGVDTAAVTSSETAPEGDAVIAVSINAAISAAFARIQTIERALSFHRPDSELSRLNHNPGTWQPLGRDGLRLLRLAKTLGRLSDNSFNATLGGELVRRGALPNHFSHEFIARGEWQDIEIGVGVARLRRPVLLTLDGIAKGYGVDMAVAVLKRRGMTGGWINAGGDLRVFGSASVAVKQRNQDGFGATLRLQNRAMASSRGGMSLDPDFPALILPGKAIVPEPAPSTATAPQTISVLARFAWRADALTKVAANLPSGESQDMIAALGGQLAHFESASCGIES